MSPKVELIKGDITKLKVDAIVNAANQALCGGGGVDGAIHKAAGPELLEECRMLKGCATGFAKITRAYNLDAKFVIHAVGPVWYGGERGETELLASCYSESLKIALNSKVESIAFPAISCGAYRFPINMATDIAVCEVKKFFSEFDAPGVVIFVAFDDVVFAAFKKAISAHFA